MDSARSNSHVTMEQRFQRGPLKVIVCLVTLWSFFNEFIIYGAKRHKSYERIKSRLMAYCKVLWRDCFRRTISAVTLVAFLVTTVSQDYAWAARQPLDLARAGSTGSGGPGLSVKELKKAFMDSVDDYLAFCVKRGEKPEKPFSGKFMLRLKPEDHRMISIAAKKEGKSLNARVRDHLIRHAAA